MDLDAFLTNTLKATVWKTSSSSRAPTGLQPGDVAIFGNWLGLRHAVFVSAKQSNGQPLFNAHTYDRKKTTLGWLFSAWTYVKYYHIVKSPITVAVAPEACNFCKDSRCDPACRDNEKFSPCHDSQPSTQTSQTRESRHDAGSVIGNVDVGSAERSHQA